MHCAHMMPAVVNPGPSCCPLRPFCEQTSAVDHQKQLRAEPLQHTCVSNWCRQIICVPSVFQQSLFLDFIVIMPYGDCAVYTMELLTQPELLYLSHKSQFQQLLPDCNTSCTAASCYSNSLGSLEPKDCINSFQPVDFSQDKIVNSTGDHCDGSCSSWQTQTAHHSALQRHQTATKGEALCL